MPSVTGKVYNHSKRMKEKRVVLDGVALSQATNISLLNSTSCERHLPFTRPPLSQSFGIWSRRRLDMKPADAPACVCEFRKK